MGAGIGAGCFFKTKLGVPNRFGREYFCGAREAVVVDVRAAQESSACCGVNLAGGKSGVGGERGGSILELILGSTRRRAPS